MNTVYLDWAATARPDPDIACECAVVSETYFANPSSPHKSGLGAREKLEEARSVCAGVLGCDPGNVVFTSCATEANNMILYSQLHKKRRGSITISVIEHASIYEPARALEQHGFSVRYVPAASDGLIDVDRFADAIDGSTSMVSFMHVNNETGAIQPVERLCNSVREKQRQLGKPIHIHCDMVQSFGKVPINGIVPLLDSASFSGHKIGAPRGSGILYLNTTRVFLYCGGGQEDGRRPGTENLPAIWGLALAAKKWTDGMNQRSAAASRLKGMLSEKLAATEGSVLLPKGEHLNRSAYSPWISMVSFPPIPGEVLVRVMSDRGYYISTGSACSSRGKKSLRVLLNMNVDQRVASSAVRISFGPSTTADDISGFCIALDEEVKKLRF